MGKDPLYSSFWPEADFPEAVGYGSAACAVTLPLRLAKVWSGQHRGIRRYGAERLQCRRLFGQRKIDKFDYLSQLIAVGNDLVGAVTVQEKKE